MDRTLKSIIIKLVTMEVAHMQDSYIQKKREEGMKKLHDIAAQGAKNKGVSTGRWYRRKTRRKE